MRKTHIAANKDDGALCRMRTTKLKIFIVGAVLICNAAATAAHEFWVAPQHYTVQPGTPIIGTLRAGEMLSSRDLPYSSSSFRSFTITTPNGTQDVEGIEGDNATTSQQAADAAARQCPSGSELLPPPRSPDTANERRPDRRRSATSSRRAMGMSGKASASASPGA